MSTRLRDVLMGRLHELRHEPTEKRIRGMVGDVAVIDSTRALLVWEPKRIVPSYAVPAEDVRGDIVPGEGAERRSPDAAVPRLGDRPVYDPSIPFAAHTTDGEPVRISAGDRDVAAFRPADPELAEHLIVDFAAFDAWYEEDERNVGHPRDPFHRIDILHSSRHVLVEVGGVPVAESTRACLLFEPPLPVRCYLPREDVRMDLLRPSDTVTFCAYKGQASYLSLGEHDDVGWTYLEPLREAAEVTGRVAFFDERTDVVIDGRRRPRPVTPWSRPQRPPAA